ncbi:sigma E regulatory protein, MucB/RseB [Polaromonas naphthalenivorans CJ2]|uniref:Sigma E regulatory protein, MucB/RseB n=2 Tax=Polaromonas naphthalenivorans TaxID=216465 RepID=A1VRT7_POLNA|nr:sigma E regulatory protein, MucB/RseB [Polaromonas naphthalenivorans CJ2]
MRGSSFKTMIFKCFRPFALVLYACTAINYVAAQVPSISIPPVAAASVSDPRSLNDWLLRMHQASSQRSYVGTFVVSAGGNMSSAKIWHVCEGKQQVERVETLTGAQRSIFRHNNQVITFMPEHKVARSEKRESLGLFPEMFQSADSRIADFYQFRREGIERVAGVDADIITLMPRDSLRFGYRVWSERQNGLVVKLQTLDTDGKVIEQAAFSELQLDAPVSMNQLIQMMGKVEGYRLEKPVLVKTTASAEGWALRAPVAGFTAMNCYKRPASSAGEGPLQWIFSDGLASVSIFVEPFDRQRHVRESSLSLGATQTLTRQLDAYWITLVGEVPAATLQLFASGLERKK